MITAEIIEESMFMSQVMSLAMQVAELDDTRLKEVISKTEVFNLMVPAEIMERVRATMAIMAFTIGELRKVVPDLNKVKELTATYKQMLSPEMVEEIDKIFGKEPK